jgi:enamine deaminase RidA (YjgF/YER057c/UK114 family)
MRKLISSGSTFERSFGYSRAVVVGNEVFVSGTTGFDYEAMTITGSAADQTRAAFANISAALAEAGATLADIVRVRYYVPNPEDWEAVGEAAGGILADIRPAATALICGLVDPRMKVEIEVDARIDPK